MRIKGKFLDARHPQAHFENEQNRLEFTTAAGVISVTQIAGLIARRIVWWIKEGETLAAGQQFGLIRFGSQVDMTFPISAQLRIKAGDRVKAGETVLAELVASGAESMKRSIYIFPSLLTLGNLASGVMAIIFSANDHFTSAAWAIIAGVILDMSDGRVARWMGATSQFGLELDSLSDLTTFGVAPAIMMYQLALSPLGRPGYMIAIFFVRLAAALRLARFNLKASQQQRPDKAFVFRWLAGTRRRRVSWPLSFSATSFLTTATSMSKPSRF